MHLVRASVATMAGDAQSDVRQGRGSQSAIFRHARESNNPTITAATGNLEVVVTQGSDLSGQDEGSVVRRFWHDENESRTWEQSRVLFETHHRSGRMSTRDGSFG